MASSPSPGTTSQWSIYSWFRGSFFSGPSSVIAEDGDHDDRMNDDLNFMELRDGKRLSKPWEHGNGSDRQSEFNDDASMVSAQMYQADFRDDYSTASSSTHSSIKPTNAGPNGSSAAPTASDTGFSTPGRGRRYLSFAECQQLPKTDYMYAYTPVYSPTNYRLRNIEMPNMCRYPIRSSSHLAAGPPPSENESFLRLRNKEPVGEIPVFGTDFDDDNPEVLTPRQRISEMLRRLGSGFGFYLSLGWFRFTLAFNLVVNSLKILFLFTFFSLPKLVFAFFLRKLSAFAHFVWPWLVFCLTRPVAVAASACRSVGSKASNAAVTSGQSAANKCADLASQISNAAATRAKLAGSKCSLLVTHFWMTIRRVAAKSKEITVAAAATANCWLRRVFWPLLLLLAVLLVVFYFPYGAVYQKATDFYEDINTTKYLEHFKWPETWKTENYVYEEPAAVPPQEPPPPPPPPTLPPQPTPVITKIDCPDCWKPFSEQIQKMLADRDKEIFANLDLKLASAASLAAMNTEAKYTAATERLALLEQAISQLRQAISDARAEAKRTLDEAETLRRDIREEDMAVVQQLVDDMWRRVDAKLTASSDAFERKLAEQQTATSEKIEATASRIGDEMRQAVDEARQMASDAMEKANSAADAVASIPPPPPPQPVVVECKTACPPLPPAPAPAAGSGGLTTAHVETIVNVAISRYDADRTGQPDFALESSGGSVVNVRCSKTYDVSAGTVSIFGFPVYFDTKSPRTAIQAGPIVPGNCWAFSGSRGFLVVRLSYRIFMTSVSLEHIPKELAPLGRLDSAPRDFSVYALANESDTVGRLLGNFTYDAVNGAALQTFATVSGDLAEGKSEPVQHVELRVLSNYGHPNYTCIYRFRVHGHPADTTAAGNNYP